MGKSVTEQPCQGPAPGLLNEKLGVRGGRIQSSYLSCDEAAQAALRADDRPEGGSNALSTSALSLARAHALSVIHLFINPFIQASRGPMSL